MIEGDDIKKAKHDRVELKFDRVMRVSGNDQLGLIVLTDMAKEREIVVTCDMLMARQIEIRANQNVNTQTWLPEVLVGAIRNIYDSDDIQMTITGLSDGQYTVMLYEYGSDMLVPNYIRASDAVLLMMVGGFPLYITRDLFMRQSYRFEGGMKDNVAVPINLLPTESLQRALKISIEKEDYETASHLRDELKQRSDASDDDSDDEK